MVLRIWGFWKDRVEVEHAHTSVPPVLNPPQRDKVYRLASEAPQKGGCRQGPRHFWDCWTRLGHSPATGPTLKTALRHTRTLVRRMTNTAPLSFSDLIKANQFGPLPAEILAITRCTICEGCQHCVVSICFYDLCLYPCIAKDWRLKEINSFVPPVFVILYNYC